MRLCSEIGNLQRRPADEKFEFMMEKLAQSPSLRSDLAAGKHSYEIKFLLTEDVAQELEWHFLDRLDLDPHGAALPGHAYPIHTLYLDTPQRDVFHRQGIHKHKKWRIRRYGLSGPMFVEQKHRQGYVVGKQRTLVQAEDLLKLQCADDCSAVHDAAFQHDLREWNLRPVCQMRYLRRAYYGNSETGAVRLTFDREVYGGLHSSWTFADHIPGQPVLLNQVICEMKFEQAMPLLFKEALDQFQMVPQGCSKYRRCLQSQIDDLALGADCA